MTFPTAEQEKQMLRDVEWVEAAIADPESHMYAPNCVPEMADVCCHVKALLSELKFCKQSWLNVQFMVRGFNRLVSEDCDVLKQDARKLDGDNERLKKQLAEMGDV